MPKLTINGISVDAPENATLLEAAAQAGIAIPTLCHAAGKRPNTSCMVCVVEDTTKGRLLPACAARVTADMIIETDSGKVHNARRAVLELLLSEHVGDCEAPCEHACPASLNIPLMLRCLIRDDINAAQTLAQQSLVLPATLGRICTAPCEAGCRRGSYDKSIAIRRIHGQLGEMPSTEEQIPPSGRTVAVIGSGPAGLAAAYMLRAHGHACRVYEKKSLAGGSLRDFPEGQLPRNVLDGEINHLVRMGIEFVFDTEVGKTISVQQVFDASHAVVVACNLNVPGQECVFRAEEKRMPVRSIAAGKHAAQAVHDYLTGTVTSTQNNYQSIIGRIPKEQLDTYVVGRGKQGLTQASDSETGLSLFSRDANDSETCLSLFSRGVQGTDGQQNQGQSRLAPDGRSLGTVPDFAEESARCLHCDCHAPVSCKLRQYATQYGVQPKVFRNAERPLPNGLQRYGDVIFDVGKCIKCGLCVAITQENKEALGLTFTQRGFTMQLSVPFNESLEKALTQSADECVNACPTGALAFETEEERIK